jgi:hypothetical protein
VSPAASPTASRYPRWPGEVTWPPGAPASPPHRPGPVAGPRSPAATVRGVVHPRCLPERRRRISLAGRHASKSPPITGVVLSEVEGPRSPPPSFDVSSPVACHPEPAGEGSRRHPLPSHPASSPSTTPHRCHLERSRESSACPTACHRCSHASVAATSNYRGRRCRAPSCLGMTGYGGRHLVPSWRATRSFDFAQDDT